MRLHGVHWHAPGGAAYSLQGPLSIMQSRLDRILIPVASSPAAAAATAAAAPGVLSGQRRPTVQLRSESATFAVGLCYYSTDVLVQSFSTHTSPISRRNHLVYKSERGEV